MKPTVQYDATRPCFIREGAHATITPINHPSLLVSNNGVAVTSTVLVYNKETGEFETENTKYVPFFGV